MSEKYAMQEWLAEIGGARVAAEKLGIKYQSVKSWENRKGWPKVELIIKLIKISKGKLSFENIVASTTPLK